MNNKIFLLGIVFLFLLPFISGTQILGDKYQDNTPASQPIAHPTNDWKECAFWRPENISNTDKITNIGLNIRKTGGARLVKLWIEIFASSTGVNIAVPSGTALMKSTSNITLNSISSNSFPNWVNWTMTNTSLGGSRTNYSICLFSNMTSSTVSSWGQFETSIYPEPSQTVNKASGSWSQYYSDGIFEMKIYKNYEIGVSDSCTPVLSGIWVINNNCNITNTISLNTNSIILNNKINGVVKINSGGLFK